MHRSGESLFIPASLKEKQWQSRICWGKPEATAREAKLETFVPKSLAPRSCLPEVRKANLPLPAYAPLILAPLPQLGALAQRPYPAPLLILFKSCRIDCPAPTQLIIPSETCS